MRYKISKGELAQAQVALLVAVALQVAALNFHSVSFSAPKYLLIGTEIGVAVLLVLTITSRSSVFRRLHKLLTALLLGFISFANMLSLGFVLKDLIITHASFSGTELLISAIAIFLTNIIVYALWYWEIDSPGLSSAKWSKHDKDFQFTQQDLKSDFKDWHPQFIDYMYVSVTNAINFAPADARPLTHQAKVLMASQSLTSVFTLALVVARSVSILN